MNTIMAKKRTEFALKHKKESDIMSISELRNKRCPARGKYICSTTCLLWAKYGVIGLSCNDALYKYPEVCKVLLLKML